MTDDIEQTETEEVSELEKLHLEVEQAHENELRAIADYKNLMRRTQEERIRSMKMAGRDVIEKILEPVEYLRLAKEQLKNKGLDMVYDRFVQALETEGVKEIACLGKDFDSNTMEVIDKQESEDKKKSGKVVKVTRSGYTLNGDVIQHAKVVISI